MKPSILSVCTVVLLLWVHSILFGQMPFQWHIIQPNSLNSGGAALVASPLGGYFMVAYGGPESSRYIRLHRLNPNGDTLWSRVFNSYYTGGTFVFRAPVKAVAAADGGLFILTANSIPQSWYNTVLRLSATGDSLWQTNISPVGQWTAAIMDQIAATTDGGCVISGAGQGFPSAPRVVKLNQNGSMAWEKTDFAMEYGYNAFKGLSINNEGKIFLTGVVKNDNNSKLLVACLDANGNKVWEHVFFSGNSTTGDSIIAYGTRTLPTPDGGCIVGGYASDPGQPGGRALLMKFSSNGNHEWTKKYFRWDYYYQKAVVYALAHQANGQYLAFIHQNDGYTTATPTFMSFDAQGDSLWTQYGLPREVSVQGLDNEGNILTYGALPHPGAAYWEHSYFLRTTPDGIFQIPENQLPSNGATNQGFEINFQWTPTWHKPNYTLQIATDSTFNNLVLTQQNILSNTYLVSGLQPNTTFFWRVKVVGHLGGSSAWSLPFKFKTMNNLGISPSSESQLIVYQITNNNKLELRLKGYQTMKPFDLALYSADGKMIWKQVLSPEPYIAVQLPQNLNRGIYIIRISGQSLNQVIKTVLAWND